MTATTVTPVFDDEPAAASRMLGAHQCPAELGISAATVRQWASRGARVDGQRRRLYSRALDSTGRPLYFEHELVQFRDAKRNALARRVVLATETVTVSHSASSTRVPHGRVLSHVRVREGVSLPDETPTEIVIPVRLDLTAAEAQLAEFCDHVRASLGEAVTSGLAVQALTVALEPPTDQP